MKRARKFLHAVLAFHRHEHLEQRRRRSIIAPPATVIEALNARFVAEGDSITAGSNGPSWTWAFDARTRGRFYMPVGYNQGTGGQTAAQMATQIAAVNALSPKVVSLLAGTNDLSGTANTPAQIYANLKTCWKGYIDGGADHVIAIKVLPRSDTTWNALSAARKADRAILNGLIGSMATDPELTGYAHKIHIVDLESVIVPATDMGDQLHPNWVGAIKLGHAIGDMANTLMQQATTLTDLYLDSSNILLAADNPALNGTGGAKTGALNTGQVADTWKLDENGGMTVVASKTSLNGANAQRVQVSGTSNAANRNVNFNAPVTVAGAIGESFEACVDFSLAAGATRLRNIVVNHATAATPNSGNQTVTMDGAGAMSGTLRTAISAPLAAPVSTVTLQCLLSFDVGAVAADITWSRPYLRKVPAGL